VHESNADDPYVTVPDHEDFDEDDAEDLAVKQTDVMIAVGKTEEEASTVEVYLYEETSGNLYVHHDFNLPSFPLSMCWMNCDPRGAAGAAAASASASASAAPAAAAEAAPGSFLAVGTFHTGIEIWNLDVLDVLEPVAVLGGRYDPDPKAIAELQARESADKKSGKGKGKKGKVSAAMAAKLLGDLKPGSHADAVMTLAWHPSFRTRLASGSADQTVKLWDVTSQQCVSTLDVLHSNKVQSIAWNSVEPQVLLSGAYDQTVAVTDVRTRAGQKGAPANEGSLRFRVPADIEQVRWSPHQPFMFAAALENGNVLFFDARAGSSGQTTPLFTLSAHTQAVTNVSFNPALPSSFMTAGVDKTVKIWDLAPTGPRLVTTKDVKAVGSIFAASFDTNYPHLLACGGDKAKLCIWDLREDANCRNQWGEEVDGKQGVSASRAAQAAQAQTANPFAMGAATLAPAASSTGAGASASAAAASSSSSASASSGQDKDKKKKKMKTSFRRKRDEE
jgi:periodic tryptophan protein 1